MDTQKTDRELMEELEMAPLVRYVLGVMENMNNDQLMTIVDRGAALLLDRDVFKAKEEPHDI